MLSRVISNTTKQIHRSGWVAWSSVAVMALAFFVATIFGGLALISSLYIQFIETRDNVLVFFEVGTDQEIIDRLKSEWQTIPQIKNIDFTSEEEAYQIYLADTIVTNPAQYKVLSEFEEKKLNSSLDIQLYSLSDLETVREALLQDIDNELAKFEEYDPKDPPILLKTDDKTIDDLRDVFSALRIGGTVILSLLFVIIFFFTLMTVEFRTYNRMEEIGVMQLVGGSLWYIRAPYILEGAVYGLLGALISGLIIGGVGAWIFVLNPQSALAVFLFERLSILPLPNITILMWIGLFAANLLAGFLLGGFSSYLAIRRYIK
ncbi:MAG: hypothetical protein JNK26_03100 [Candidatus Doudnabacteria bacterium]|nr:hypothetical protein [Candidatus Doudnabacteria bacterium]